MRNNTFIKTKNNLNIVQAKPKTTPTNKIIIRKNYSNKVTF